MKKSIADVFLIAQDFVNGACPPLGFSGDCEKAVRFKDLSDFVNCLIFKVLSANALYDFSLFRVDDKVFFIIISVAKKMVVVDLNLIIMVNKASINRKMKSQITYLFFVEAWLLPLIFIISVKQMNCVFFVKRYEYL